MGGVKVSVARFVSIAGHPLALLVLAAWLLHAPGGVPGGYRLTLPALGIVILPLGLLTWRARATGRWQTVDASDKKDRPVLYLTIGLVLLGLAAYFHFVEPSPRLLQVCAVYGAMMLAAFLLNPYVKLSLHVTFATFCGLLLADVRLAYGLPILLGLPVLMWSRVALRRHTLPETLVGLALGTAGAVCLLLLSHRTPARHATLQNSSPCPAPLCLAAPSFGTVNSSYFLASSSSLPT